MAAGPQRLTSPARSGSRGRPGHATIARAVDRAAPPRRRRPAALCSPTAPGTAALIRPAVVCAVKRQIADGRLSPRRDAPGSCVRAAAGAWTADGAGTGSCCSGEPCLSGRRSRARQPLLRGAVSERQTEPGQAAAAPGSRVLACFWRTAETAAGAGMFGQRQRLEGGGYRNVRGGERARKRTDE